MSNSPKTRSVAIGNFDGFHLGHREITRRLKEISGHTGSESMILTFTPNPKVFFRSVDGLISTDLQKREIISECSINSVEFLDFYQIKDMDGRAFVKDILKNRFGCSALVVGRNFKFGKKRQEGIEALKRYSSEYDFKLHVIEPVYLNSVRVSSSYIRLLLKEGDVKSASAFLGRDYFIDGKVVRGKGIGKRIGFPTMNLSTQNTVLPGGVFKSELLIKGERYTALTNVGVRPTFNGSSVIAEVHIPDFNNNVYGEEVRLFFKDKIRNEMRFASEEELTEQIRRDIKCLKD